MSASRMSAAGQYVSDTNGGGNDSDEDVWATALGLRIGSGGFEGTLAWGHHNNVGVNGR